MHCSSFIFNTEMSLWSYLYAEINRGYHLEHEEEKFTEKRKRVQMFIRIPLELEKVKIIGPLSTN